MATDLVEINQDDPQPEALERAAAAVRRGRVVAIPTDALYTLVADPFNLRAVDRVYEIKAMDMSKMTLSEKKALRTELKSVKKELKAVEAIYIPIGTAIIVLLLLLLLL